MKRLHRVNSISRACAQTPMHVVLAMAGVEVAGPPPPGTSLKIWCVNSHLHPDGGREREMRLYSDNKAYCHICRKQYDPVSLAAQVWDCSQKVAALRLLVGSTDSDEQSAPQYVFQLRAGAVAALGVWADAHEIDRLGPEYQSCLNVASRITDSSHVIKWLEVCKKVLSAWKERV